MAIRNGVFYPDMEAQQVDPRWVPMGDDEPVDLGQPASAFKQRFLGNGEPPAHAGSPAHVPTDVPVGPMGHEGGAPVDELVHGGPVAKPAAGGFKSL